MTQPIKIAILAMGGEGGGVLADWLVNLAEHADWIAQTTSVPGVAQRTGATIYYVELFPGDAARAAGQAPVLALMPLPGDVDIVLASELMEAGRAVQRGLVTPERTTLLTSTHRVYAIAEKVAMGDGRSDSDQLLQDVRAAAQRFVGFDMAATAEAQGSLVSAVLLGALAATRALPFEPAQFEATIERGGVGVQASLRAFRAAVVHALEALDAGVAERAATPPAPTTPPASAAPEAPPIAVGTAGAAPLPRSANPEVQALIDRGAQVADAATRALVLEGLRRLVDYQDPAYAALYLDRLAAAPQAPALQQALARHLALWMSYEDTVRVAELKTRGSRFERVRDEVRASDAQLLSISEYLHPRLQEIAETLPAALGRWLLASGWPRRAVQRLGERGRVVRTSGLRGFLLLWSVSRLKRWRRASLRFALETTRIEQWLADVRAAAAHSETVALELVLNQRLVKGYGDTHARGLRSYERLRQAWQAGVDAPGIARLREAALADEDGRLLEDTWRRMNLAPAAPATDLKDAPA
jgi:indolepyruvate ferredoxin oxidoreductase, beta subunit